MKSIMIALALLCTVYPAEIHWSQPVWIARTTICTQQMQCRTAPRGVYLSRDECVETERMVLNYLAETTNERIRARVRCVQEYQA